MFSFMFFVIGFSSIIFFCESGIWDKDKQTYMRPNVFGTGSEPTPFLSIPHSMWWAVVTMVSVFLRDKSHCEEQSVGLYALIFFYFPATSCVSLDCADDCRIWW